MPATLALAPLLHERLTDTQRAELARLLAEPGVVAYGVVDGTLEVLVQVDDARETGTDDTPWRIAQAFTHGVRWSTRVGPAQAHRGLAAILAAGGEQVGPLPDLPEGWYGCR